MTKLEEKLELLSSWQQPRGYIMSGVFLVLLYFSCLGCTLSSHAYTQLRPKGLIVQAKAEILKRLARKYEYNSCYVCHTQIHVYMCVNYVNMFCGHPHKAAGKSKVISIIPA